MAFLDNTEYGSSTLRYPLQPPVMDQDFNGDSVDGLTGRTDYLRVRRKKTVYTDAGKDYYGMNNFPRNKARSDFHNSIAYLAVPGGINSQYSPVYNQANLGVGGAAAISALGRGQTFEQVAGALGDAARSVLPEFLAGTISSGANALSGFLGVQGNLSVNSLEGLTSGRVFNPYVEQIFSQMNFRNHSFSFKMFARNYKEAQEIKKIIQYIKVGAHPKVGENVDQESKLLDQINDKKDGDTVTVPKTKIHDFVKDNGGTLSQNRYFGIPDQYELAFMRMNPKSGEFNDTLGYNYQSQTDTTSMNLHYKMDTCVCSGISVNYTPDNQYTAMKRIDGSMIQVPAVQMDVQFTEVRLLSQSDIMRGY